MGMDIKGHIVEILLLEEASKILEEYYISFTLDRSEKKYLIMLSSKGGMDIEKVAEDNPDDLIKHHIGASEELTEDIIHEIIGKAKLNQEEDFAFEDDFDEDFGDSLADEIQEQGYWFTSENLIFLESIHDYLEGRNEIGKVLSVSSGVKIAEIANNNNRLSDVELALLRSLLPEEIESQLLSSYISSDDNQVRLTARVIAVSYTHLTLPTNREV